MSGIAVSGLAGRTYQGAAIGERLLSGKPGTALIQLRDSFAKSARMSKISGRLAQEFLGQPVEWQAKLIGIDARNHLGMIQQVIDENWKPISPRLNWPDPVKKTTAVELWERVLATQYNSTEAEKIKNALFPQLSSGAEVLGGIFEGFPEFWVHDIFLGGDRGIVNTQGNKWSKMPAEQQLLIDAEAGITGLGRRMRDYAYALWMNAD